MKPTIGRIVVYKTTQEDKKKMKLSAEKCIEQDRLPAVIVSVQDESSVNLRVFCDGDLTLHKTAVVNGSKEGNWSWLFPPQKQ